jgi:cell division protein FtsB
MTTKDDDIVRMRRRIESLEQYNHQLEKEAYRPPPVIGPCMFELKAEKLEKENKQLRLRIIMLEDEVRRLVNEGVDAFLAVTPTRDEREGAT